MIGWRFWVLLVAGIGFVLWAASALVLLEAGEPLSTGELAPPGRDAGADVDLIREESREAIRDILRQAEGSE